MITKAAKQAVQTYITYPKANNTNTAIPSFPNDPIKDVDGNNRWVSFGTGDFLSSITMQTGNNKNDGIHFGSGTTAPTENDYYLQTPITSYLGATIQTSVRGIDAGKPYMEFRITVTNNSTTSNMTVAEIGLISRDIWCCTSSTGTSIAMYNILVDRTLLEQPIVLSPLQTGAIRYRITCDMSFS